MKAKDLVLDAEDLLVAREDSYVAQALNTSPEKL